MRQSREETARSRERIIEAASHLFRERGPGNVSVAEIMSAAGMTHGGFYTHFDTKEALQAAATEHAFAEKLELLREGLSRADQSNLRNYIDGYLSIGHVRDRSVGCPIAGLGLDADRATEPMKSAMSMGATALIETIALSLVSTSAEPRREAIAAISTMIGAIVLARAADHPDLQRDIIDAARRTAALEKFLD